MGDDIFSFGVMVFECFSWGEAYPTSFFKCPWQISEFVQARKRVQTLDVIPDDMYDLASQCWAQEPDARIGLFLVQVTSRHCLHCLTARQRPIRV